MDIFGGNVHIRTTRWVFSSKHGDTAVYAMLHLEIHSAFIPKVWFGHITLAKFTWPGTPFVFDSLPPSKRAVLIDIGKRFSALFNWSTILDPAKVSPPSPLLWHRRLECAWTKVAILLNFMHPVHQKLRNLRSDLAAALPSAHMFDRGSFHISIDGIVHFEIAVPGSAYFDWPLHEISRVFTYNCTFGVYSDNLNYRRE